MQPMSGSMKKTSLMIATLRCCCLCMLLLLGWPLVALAQTPEPAGAEPWRTFFVTRSLAHERLLPFLQEARPDVVQIGNYGAMFHGYADHPKSTGWPMQLPVSGEAEALRYQRELNAKVHDLGLSVVGHFRLVKVMGHWGEQTGFVEYYNQRWPTELLGPKPHQDLRELLQRDAEGKPIQLGRYNQSQLALCLSSPYARKMLRQMLRVAINQGIDGVNTTYNYRFGCACEHCQSAFKGWLKEHTSDDTVKSLGIQDWEQHRFNNLPAQIPGYPGESNEQIDWLAARWGAEHFKQVFDEIFLEYGAAVYKDRVRAQGAGQSPSRKWMVAQWNHLSNVSVSEERAFLPASLWGRGEDYFWYSGGAAFVGKNLSLAEGKAGDAWLDCLYVRALGNGKPFVIGKYDRTRLAASMAEGFATGGLGMGRYMRFEEPAGFEVLSRYIRFANKRRMLLDTTEPLAEIALVLPRQSIWNRRPESLDAFRTLGQALVEQQTLCQVLVDERISTDQLRPYRCIVLPRVAALSDDQLAALRAYQEKGGQLIIHGHSGTLDEQGEPRAEYLPSNVTFSGDEKEVAAEVCRRARDAARSHIEAPWTVRAAAYRTRSGVSLHLVNYDRHEDAKASGPAMERPKEVSGIRASLLLPEGRRVLSVGLHQPEHPSARRMEYSVRDGVIRFELPPLNVYGVVEIQLSDR